MFARFKRPRLPADGLSSSGLFHERTFYQAFISDLSNSKDEVIIESPFIAGNRMRVLLPKLRGLTQRGVKVTINTRDPKEHDAPFAAQAIDAIENLQLAGVRVLFTDNHHRKLAILDRKILWEGSLNILSQNSSCEIMRRIESEGLAREMIEFTTLNKFLR